MSIIKKSLLGLGVAVVMTAATHAAEDTFVPIFVDTVADPAVENLTPAITESEIVSEPMPEAETTVTDDVAVPEVQYELSGEQPKAEIETEQAIAPTEPMPDSAPSTNAAPTSGLDDLQVNDLIGMPLELAEFEIAFSPIITVSDAGVRARWTCEKKDALQAAATKVARAPIFEMTKRNFDTWRTNAKLLKSSIDEAVSHCGAADANADKISAELDKARDAWLVLMQSRG